MKKKYFVVFLCFCMTTPLIGCGSPDSDRDAAQTEILQEQVAQLEEQIQALQQQLAQESGKETGENSSNAETVSIPSESSLPQDDGNIPAGSVSAAVEEKNDTAAAGNNYATTDTMEELTELVNNYVAKANAAIASGTMAEDMEQFFALKQEEKTIDDALDRHEDELEYLYHQNQISREDYKNADMALERLEDKLDQAEDRLELIFGIDD